MNLSLEGLSCYDYYIYAILRSRASNDSKKESKISFKLLEMISGFPIYFINHSVHELERAGYLKIYPSEGTSNTYSFKDAQKTFNTMGFDFIKESRLTPKDIAFYCAYQYYARIHINDGKEYFEPKLVSDALGLSLTTCIKHIENLAKTNLLNNIQYSKPHKRPDGSPTGPIKNGYEMRAESHNRLKEIDEEEKTLINRLVLLRNERAEIMKF